MVDYTDTFDMEMEKLAQKSFDFVMITTHNCNVTTLIPLTVLIEICFPSSHSIILLHTKTCALDLCVLMRRAKLFSIHIYSYTFTHTVTHSYDSSYHAQIDRNEDLPRSNSRKCSRRSKNLTNNIVVRLSFWIYLCFWLYVVEQFICI